ncbi:MAG: hypothetical protein HYY17_05745 [Planctomycetes bacterium]|nr:hypothetical protein [Planctomycetota bacterium]
MKLLVRRLTPSDREHLKKILNSSISVTPAGLATVAKVHRFLKEKTYISDRCVPRFRALTPPERERVLSELLWRLTCYLDGSETLTMGASSYDLGGGFAANCVEHHGEHIFCLVEAKDLSQ